MPRRSRCTTCATTLPTRAPPTSGRCCTTSASPRRQRRSSSPARRRCRCQSRARTFLWRSAAASRRQPTAATGWAPTAASTLHSWRAATRAGSCWCSRRPAATSPPSSPPSPPPLPRPSPRTAPSSSTRRPPPCSQAWRSSTWPGALHLRGLPSPVHRLWPGTRRATSAWTKPPSGSSASRSVTAVCRWRGGGGHPFRAKCPSQSSPSGLAVPSTSSSGPRPRSPLLSRRTTARSLPAALPPLVSGP
mmetsp:Transcript_22256/g.87661  ORF Transcript_22256/g.87661 Transcript_22256/m.87661 type:complete len:247 (+) Transcript_22256:1006-1746(+)